MNNNPFVFEVAVLRGSTTTRYYFSDKTDAREFAVTRGKDATVRTQQFRIPQTAAGLAALLTQVEARVPYSTLEVETVDAGEMSA